MNGINEVLVTQHGATWRECHQFTVAHASVSVPIDDDPAVKHILRAAKDYDSGGGVLKGLRLFQPNDNMRILSVGVKFPYQFALAQKPIWMRVLWCSFPGVPVRRVLTLGNEGEVWIPGENYELLTDVYWKYQQILPIMTNGYFRIELMTASGADDYAVTQISMLNCPASLVDGTKLDVVAFLKVNHNLPMIAG